VALTELALGWVRMTWRLGAALLAGALGTAIVIASGADVSITTAGTLFALGAALSFAFYLLATDRLLVTTDNMVRAAWVSGGAGLSLFVRGLVTGGFDSPSGFWPRLIGIGMANAAAFGFLFVALTRIGATRTAVVLNVEPVGAVILGSTFLGERLGPVQLAGGALVIVAAIVVALPERAASTEAVVPVHPPP
jgi:drug/metabolite transporter (DMT)-like permease